MSAEDILHVVLMIRVGVQIAVSKSKMENLTAENVPMSATTYKIAKDRGVNVRLEKTELVSQKS